MIRKDDILKMTEKGISVFRYYLPVDFKVEKNFLNPFYKDTKASCNIYYERKAGVFKMKDFGNEDYSGDCFELVGRLNGLSCKEPKEFVEIMEMINRDLHLGLSAHEEYHVSHSKVPKRVKWYRKNRSRKASGLILSCKKTLRLWNLPFGVNRVSGKMF